MSVATPPQRVPLLLALAVLACGPGTSGVGDDTGTGDTGDTGDDPYFPQGAPCGGHDTECGDVPEGMVCVPAGEVTLGGGYMGIAIAEVRDVCLPTFYLDRTEVSVADFEACIDAGGCEDPGAGQSSCSWSQASSPDLPVSCVPWQTAVDYCAWLGKRLPIRDEWEKAARGSDGRLYPWGNGDPSCEVAVFNPSPDDNPDTVGCGRGEPWPVGAKAPAGASPFDAANMAGNVAEFTADQYEYEDPPVPMEDWFVIVVGGFYGESNPATLLTFAASATEIDRPATGLGFRCAMDGPG